MLPTAHPLRERRAAQLRTARGNLAAAVLCRATRRRQRGVGFSGALIIVSLVVFFVNLAIVVLPSYAAFWQVREIMDRLPEKTDVIQAGPRAIMTSVSTQLGINNVRDIGGKDFKLQRTPDGFNLLLDYEVRKHWVYNIDLVMAFEHQVPLPKP
jgi:hypothetical protein